MLYRKVKHLIAMKPSHFSNELLLVCQKNILFAITLTWLKTVFTKKTLIFLKAVN